MTSSRDHALSASDGQGDPALAIPEGLRIPMIALREPSEAELRAASLQWFDRIGDTLLDRLPPEVLALSMPTRFIRFPGELAAPLFELGRGVHPGLQELADELDRQMGWDRHFIRLNSRSPKDSPWPFETPATCSGKEAIGIMACSERMLEDLVSFAHIPEHPAYICLRDFVPGLRPSEELRCFVKDGELIAVSHYDYLNPITPPIDGGREIRERVETWFRDVLKPRLHIQTVVFDVWIGWNRDPLLIELNPYGLSDPCWLGSYENVENFGGHVAFSRPRDGAHEASTSDRG